MHNLLENWKQECYVLSSSLSLDKLLERTDVDSIYKIFADYFGLDYFIIAESTPNTKSIWLHFLLANPKRPACIAALFETANILIYLQTLAKSTQKKFKTLFADPRQFRDIFFEIYDIRLLDYNKIPHKKKPKEGNKELDILCTLNEKEYLCECRKLYTPDYQLLDTQRYLMEILNLKLRSLSIGFGLIGTIKFKDVNNIKLKEIFDDKLNKFINGFKEGKFHTIDYHDIDGNGELSVFDYSNANNIEVEKNLSHYHLIFKIIPPFNPIPNIKNHYQVELKAGLNISQRKITNKLFSAIKDKNEQHVNSKYANKIYFIDSETLPDFELPIFRMDSMFEEDKIKDYLESYSENEIVCFIRREYLEEVPKISIKAFGKNIDIMVKQQLESLKTNFDYRIEINNTKRLPLNSFRKEL